MRYGFRFSQDILRLLLYSFGALLLVHTKWYIGFPSFITLWVIGNIIENTDTEIRQLRNIKKKRGGK